MTANAPRDPRSRRSKAILEGHKRVKKRLVPPILAMNVPVGEVNYVSDMIPEILWIALLLDSLGNREGVEISRRIATAAHSSNPAGNYGMVSTYSGLSAKQKGTVTAHIEASGFLPRVQESLAPLSTLYEGFPLAFLGLPVSGDTEKGLIRRLKRVLASLFDKGSSEATLALATLFYIKCGTGIYHFPEGFKVPNFDSLINAPKSEEAMRVRWLVRTASISDLRPAGVARESSWSHSFWNQGIIVDNCELGAANE